MRVLSPAFRRLFIVAHAASLRLSRIYKVDFYTYPPLNERKLAACATTSRLKAGLKTVYFVQVSAITVFTAMGTVLISYAMLVPAAAFVMATGGVGVSLDAEANEHGRQDISTRDSRVDVLVIPTSEETTIARHCAALLNSGACA